MPSVLCGHAIGIRRTISPPITLTSWAASLFVLRGAFFCMSTSSSTTNHKRQPRFRTCSALCKHRADVRSDGILKFTIWLMGAVVPSTLHCASDMLQCIRAGERFLLRAWKREHHQIPWPSSNRHTRSPGPVHTVHIPAAFAASALKLPLSRIIRASDKRLMRALAAMVPTGWPASPRGQAALSVSCVRPRSEPRRAASAGPTVRAYVQPPSAGPGADDSAPGPAAVRRWAGPRY